MTTVEWIGVINSVFMIGTAIFLGVNRWVNSRSTSETKLTRDLAESDRFQKYQDGVTDAALKRNEARIEQVHGRASDRMDAIDRHLSATDSRLVTIETILKFKP